MDQLTSHELFNKSLPCCEVARFRTCAQDIYIETCGERGGEYLQDLLKGNEIVNHANTQAATTIYLTRRHGLVQHLPLSIDCLLCVLLRRGEP